MGSLSQSNKRQYKPQNTKKSVSVDIQGMGSDLKNTQASDNFATLISNFEPGKGSEWNKREGTFLVNSITNAGGRIIANPDYSIMFEDGDIVRHFIIKDGIMYDKDSNIQPWYEAIEYVNYNLLEENRDKSYTKATEYLRHIPGKLDTEDVEYSYKRPDEAPATLPNTNKVSTHTRFKDYMVWTIGNRILLYPLNGQWVGKGSGDTFVPITDDLTGLPSVSTGAAYKFWIEATAENLDVWTYSQFGSSYNVNFLSDNPGYRTQSFIPSSTKGILINQQNDGEVTNTLAEGIVKHLTVLAEEELSKGVIQQALEINVYFDVPELNLGPATGSIFKYENVVTTDDMSDNALIFDLSSFIPTIIDNIKRIDTELQSVSLINYVNLLKVNLSYTSNFDTSKSKNAFINIIGVRDQDTELEVEFSINDEKVVNHLVKLDAESIGYIVLEKYDQTTARFIETARRTIDAKFARSSISGAFSFTGSWAGAEEGEIYRVSAYYTHEGNLPVGAVTDTHDLIYYKDEELEVDITGLDASEDIDNHVWETLPSVYVTKFGTGDIFTYANTIGEEKNIREDGISLAGYVRNTYRETDVVWLCTDSRSIYIHDNGSKKINTSDMYSSIEQEPGFPLKPILHSSNEGKRIYDTYQVIEDTLRGTKYIRYKQEEFRILDSGVVYYGDGYVEKKIYISANINKADDGTESYGNKVDIVDVIPAVGGANIIADINGRRYYLPIILSDIRSIILSDGTSATVSVSDAGITVQDDIIYWDADREILGDVKSNTYGNLSVFIDEAGIVRYSSFNDVGERYATIDKIRTVKDIKLIGSDILITHKLTEELNNLITLNYFDNVNKTASVTEVKPTDFVSGYLSTSTNTPVYYITDIDRTTGDTVVTQYQRKLKTEDEIPALTQIVVWDIDMEQIVPKGRKVVGLSDLQKEVQLIKGTYDFYVVEDLTTGTVDLYSLRLDGDETNGFDVLFENLGTLPEEFSSDLKFVDSSISLVDYKTNQNYTYEGNKLWDENSDISVKPLEDVPYVNINTAESEDYLIDFTNSSRTKLFEEFPWMETVRSGQITNKDWWFGEQADTFDESKKYEMISGSKHSNRNYKGFKAHARDINIANNSGSYITAELFNNRGYGKKWEEHAARMLSTMDSGDVGINIDELIDLPKDKYTINTIDFSVGNVRRVATSNVSAEFTAGIQANSKFFDPAFGRANKGNEDGDMNGTYKTYRQYIFSFGGSVIEGNYIDYKITPEQQIDKEENANNWIYTLIDERHYDELNNEGWSGSNSIPLVDKDDNDASLNAWARWDYSGSTNELSIRAWAEMFSGNYVDGGSLATTGSIMLGQTTEPICLAIRNIEYTRLDTVEIVQLINVEEDLTKERSAIKIVRWKDPNGEIIDQRVVYGPPYYSSNILIKSEEENPIDLLEKSPGFTGPVSAGNMFDIRGQEIDLESFSTKEFTYYRTIIEKEAGKSTSYTSKMFIGNKYIAVSVVGDASQSLSIDEESLYTPPEGETITSIVRIFVQINDIGNELSTISILNGNDMIQQVFDLDFSDTTDSPLELQEEYAMTGVFAGFEEGTSVIVQESADKQGLIVVTNNSIIKLFKTDAVSGLVLWHPIPLVQNLDIDTNQEVYIRELQAYTVVVSGTYLYLSPTLSSLLSNNGELVQKLESVKVIIGAEKIGDIDETTEIEEQPKSVFNTFESINTNSIVTSFKNIAKTVLAVNEITGEPLYLFDTDYGFTTLEVQHHIREVNSRAFNLNETLDPEIVEFLLKNTDAEVGQDYDALVAYLDSSLHINYNVRFKVGDTDEVVEEARVFDIGDNDIFQNDIISQSTVSAGVYQASTEYMENPYARIITGMTAGTIADIDENSVDTYINSDGYLAWEGDEDNTPKVVQFFAAVSLDEISIGNTTVALEKALNLTALAENDFFKIVTKKTINEEGVEKQEFSISDSRWSPYINYERFIPNSTGRVMVISIVLPWSAAVWVDETEFTGTDSEGNTVNSQPEDWENGSKWIKQQSLTQLLPYTQTKIINITQDETEVDKALTMRNTHNWVDSCEYYNSLLLASEDSIYISDQSNPFYFPSFVTSLPVEFGKILRIFQFQGMLLVIFEKGFAAYQPQQTSDGTLFFSEPLVTRGMPTIVSRKGVTINSKSIDVVTYDGIYRIYQVDATSVTGIPLINTAAISSLIASRLREDIRAAKSVAAFSVNLKTYVRLTLYEELEGNEGKVEVNKVYIYDTDKDYGITKANAKWYVWESDVFDFDQLEQFVITSDDGVTNGMLFFTRKNFAEMLRFGYTQEVGGDLVSGHRDRAVATLRDGVESWEPFEDQYGNQFNLEVESVILTNALNVENDYDLKVKIISHKFNHYGFPQNFYRQYYLLDRKTGEFVNSASNSDNDVYEVVNTSPASSDLLDWSITYKSINGYRNSGTITTSSDLGSRAIFGTLKTGGTIFNEIETYDKKDFTLEDKTHLGTGRTAQIKTKLIHVDDRPFTFKGINFVVKEKKHK